MSTRTERIKELLKIEISDILLRDIKDPRLGFVTITDADVSRDLKHARIFVSIMGTPEEKAASMDVLNRAARHIRAEFGKRAFLKTIPEITFQSDTAVEHGARIFELLQQVKKDEQK